MILQCRRSSQKCLAIDDQMHPIGSRRRVAKRGEQKAHLVVGKARHERDKHRQGYGIAPIDFSRSHLVNVLQGVRWTFVAHRRWHRSLALYERATNET
jgi:hypothetical protein